MEDTKIDYEKRYLKLKEEYDDFLYIISHDINTPIRIIRSFLSLLKKNYSANLDDEANEYIDFAVENANKLTQMVKGLLTISRVKTRGKAFDKIDLNICLENALGNLANIIEDRNATITKTSLPELIVDSEQITQVFESLITNALKFHDNENGRPEITINYKYTDSKHIFSIEDNGIGIPDKHFEKIFKIFQRLHLEDEYEGIGLGLTLCKTIIERHNGSIWVESEIDKGSKFIFVLPE